MQFPDEGPTEKLNALREAITTVVDEATPYRSRRNWSRALGRHSRYLDRSLRGDRALPTFVETAQLLEMARLDPRDFFFGLYPPGGDLERRLVETQNTQAPGFDLSALNRELAHQYPALSPTQAESRAREQLKGYLQDAEISQEQAGERLFEAPDAVHDFLSGRTDLRFERLFPLLDLVQQPLWRFFRDLYGPEDIALTSDLTWQGLLEWLDRLDQDNVEKFAAEREASDRHPSLALSRQEDP